MHAMRTATLALALLLLGGLAACTGGATPVPSVGTPSSSSPASPSPGASGPAAAATAAPSGSTARVVTVAWGQIWDAVPARLPLPAGAKPATPADPSIGTASAIYTTPLQPQAAADQLKADYVKAGYSVEGLSSGEDGSVALSLNGAGTCRVMVTVTPLGSVRFLSVYYGADCPRP